MKSFFLHLLGLLGLASVAAAADFTVINTASIGPGSLHQAILDANALPGLDRIVFNIPGAGPHKIKLSSTGLPNVRDQVIIDGYTQPGASPNTLSNGDNAIIKIQIDGAYDEGTGLEYAIVLSDGAAGSIVRGLSITGLTSSGGPYPYPPGAAIRIVLDGNSTIEGNFLGLEPDGTSARGNQTGVEVGTNGNIIGGSTPAARNVIAGNGYGIVLFGSSANTVSGNFIGTDASGTQARNQGTGILVLSSISNITIGGTSPEKTNVISGHFGSGIRLGMSGNFHFPTNGVVVTGNLIGTTANGIDPLPNHEDGIIIFGSQNVIGGLEPGAANTIAYNLLAGVGILPGTTNSPCVGNQILSNAIRGGSYPPIDLGRDGLTSNDLGDTDTGPNKLQNFPVITGIDPPAANGDVTIHGELNSTPSSGFLLQFFYFKYPAPARLLGNVSVTTTAGGRARFDFVAPGLGPLNNGFIIPTATDSAGNTSEFGGFGPVELVNISTRANIGTGDNILIGGFVLHEGPQPPKKLLIRAIGPSLNISNHLSDPYLELYDEHGVLLAKNDDWGSNQQQVMDSGLPPSNSLESAMVVSLKAGSYTAQVRGVNGATGVGVVEIYGLDPSINAGIAHLVNLSTRGQVGANENVLIGGLIVRGDTAQRLIARAIGPDLIAVGLPGLPDPMLELRDESGTLLATNDNWRDTQAEEIQNTKLAPNDNRDSAIVTTLAPGYYTAIVRGKQNATGLGLVEFYTLFPISNGPPTDNPTSGR